MLPNSLARSAATRLVVPILAGAAALAMPAAAAARDDAQGWAAATVNVDLGGGFRASNETVLRFSDNRGGLYEVEDNLMVGYKPNKQVTLWLGYTHNPQYDHGDFTRMEHRFRQQVNIDNFLAIGRVKFSGRLRLEERWREGQGGPAWRLRPFVKAAVPLKGKVNLVLSHESFIDLNTSAFQRVGGKLGALTAFLDDLDYENTAEFFLDEAESHFYGFDDKEVDEEQAKLFYIKAYEKGSKKACLALGRLAKRDEDIKNAVHYFKEGAQKGEVDCYAELADFFSEKGVVETSEQCWDRYFINEPIPSSDYAIKYLTNFTLKHRLQIKHLEVLRPQKKNLLNMLKQELDLALSILENESDSFRKEYGAVCRERFLQKSKYIENQL